MQMNPDTGGAWLSSARVVKCLVKSNNERNPRLELPVRLLRDCRCKLEEGEDDVKSSCPLRPGRHMCYNGWDNTKQTEREAKRTNPSSVRIAGCNSPA